VGFAVLALIAVRFTWDVLQHDTGPAELSEGIGEVVRVVDGDTLIVRQRNPAADGDSRWSEARVRLLGIDAPETVRPEHPIEPWGPEAADFARDFVSGQEVQLQFDKRRVDRFGRVLAYVYVGDRMLNEELVRAGLARASDFPGDSQAMARRIRKAEEEARRAGRGLWSR
jgi:micrococcal nuclease